MHDHPSIADGTASVNTPTDGGACELMSHVDMFMTTRLCDVTGSIHQTAKHIPTPYIPVFNFGGWGWTQNHAVRSGNETASLPVLILASSACGNIDSIYYC